MLILTGPPAAGKNTVAHCLARLRERCAVVDCDTVRAMLVQPHRAPWDGVEGQRQHLLGIDLTCQLASGFAAAGCEVVILDVLSAESAVRYRAALAEFAPQIIQLLPSWEVCERRFRERAPTLNTDEFAALYRAQAAFSGFHERIDNSTLTPEAVAERLHLLTVPRS